MKTLLSFRGQIADWFVLAFVVFALFALTASEWIWSQESEDDDCERPMI